MRFACHVTSLTSLLFAAITETCGGVHGVRTHLGWLQGKPPGFLGAVHSPQSLLVVPNHAGLADGACDRCCLSHLCVPCTYSADRRR